MNRNLHISASLDQPALLESMIERLALKHYDIGYGNALVPTSHKALESSSIETYVSGTVQICLNGNEPINMPFISCFLFTCTKEKRKEYKLNWGISLC